MENKSDAMGILRSDFYAAGLIGYRIIVPIFKHMFIAIFIFLFVLLSIASPFIGIPLVMIFIALGTIRLTLDIILLISYISEEICVTDKGIEGKASFFKKFCLSFDDVKCMIRQRSSILVVTKSKKRYVIFNVENYMEVIDTFYRRAAVAANNTEKEEQTEEQ